MSGPKSWKREVGILGLLVVLAAAKENLIGTPTRAATLLSSETVLPST